MAKRGKVLRDCKAGPGLLMVEGQQYAFALEGVWRSEIAPKPGQVVDLELDPMGRVASVTAVADSQLAREQAEIALKAAKEQGGKIFGQVVAKVGAPNLVAILVLLISWWWLTAVSIDVPFLGKLEFTFWQLLGLLNASSPMEILERNLHPSSGVYGFFALVCAAGPFVPFFWKGKRASLGGLLPIVFMVITGIMARSAVINAMGDGAVSGPYGDMQRQAQDEMMKAVSYGAGLYLSILASLYFAGMGLKNFLLGKATEPAVVPQKVAA